MNTRRWKHWEDRILDVVADVVARAIVGGGAALLACALFADRLVALSLCYPEVLLIPAAFGVYFTIFGIRNGPGVI